MMVEILVADTAAKGLGLGLGLLRSCKFSITAAIQPYDAVAPPPVKPSTYRIPRRTLLRKKRRTKRRLSGDDAGDAGDEGFFFGDSGDGPFGSSGGGGGGFGGSGGGSNFDRFGDESSSSLPDPAFDFVYQVLSWIMLLNCLHFAFKKIVRILSDGSIVDSDREKVPTRLAPIY